MIRSFTLSRSKWSSSRIRARVLEVEVVLGRASFQGSVRIQSRYVRMTPYSAAAGGSRSRRASSRLRAFAHVLGQLQRLEPLAQLVDLRLLARRPRRARPGSPSAAGGGRTRAGPSPSPTAPATGSSSRAPTPRARGSGSASTARSRSSTLTISSSSLPLLGLQAHRRGDEVAERARVVDVRGRELQLLGQVGREADDARELVLDVARQRLDLGRLRELRPAAARTRRRGTGRRAAARRGARGGAPWTRIRSVPSGTLIILWTIATVPTRRCRPSPAPRPPVRGPRRARAAGRRRRRRRSAGRALLADRERRHRLREDDRLLQRQHRQDRRLAAGVPSAGSKELDRSRARHPRS